MDEGQRLKKPLKARAGQVVLVRFELAAESGKVTSARQAFFAIRHPTQRESQVTIRANIVKGRFVGKLVRYCLVCTLLCPGSGAGWEVRLLRVFMGGCVVPGADSGGPCRQLLDRGGVPHGPDCG